MKEKLIIKISGKSARLKVRCRPTRPGEVIVPENVYDRKKLKKIINDEDNV